MSHGFQRWFINTIATINYFDALKMRLSYSEPNFKYGSNYWRDMRKLREASESDDKIFKWGDEVFDVSQNGVTSKEKTWKYIN